MNRRTSLGLILLAAGLCAARPLVAGAREQPFLIRNGDVVVFYGDSITCGEWYPTLIETYVVTRFPAWRNQFFVRGVSGDRAANLKRFDRDVVQRGPDVLTYMMGYNDAGHRRFEPDKLEAFVSNVTVSVAMARAARPGVRILLASAPVNETFISDDPLWASRDAYPYALLTFGREEGRLAARLGTSFVDIAARYGETMGLGHVIARKAFGLSRDGVHPQQEGQTFIAFHYLQAMGADPLLAEVRLDAVRAKARAQRCRVSDLKVANGIVSFQRVCEALPYPTPEVARPFAFLVRLDDALNNDRLVVSGLTAPAYAIEVDGRPIAQVAAQALADGVNLSLYPDTPMQAQAQAVLQAVREKQELEAVYWWSHIVPGRADGAGAPSPTNAAAARAAMAADLKALAAKTEANHRLAVPRPHTIRLVPLDKKISPYDFADRQDIAQAFLDITPQPVNVDWKTMALRDKAFTVTVANPNRRAHSGRLTWHSEGGVLITPAEQAFSVPAGTNLSLTFAVACPPGATLFPVPTYTARWQWSEAWAFPVTDAGELTLRPYLAIPKARTRPVVDGALTEWDGAASFTLDQPEFMDRRVKGKRALWDGPADLSATIFLQWDDQALYVGARVRDQDHVKQRGADWRQDLLHVAVIAQELTARTVRHEFGFAAYADGDDCIAIPTLAAPLPAFKSCVDVAAGTCTYEAAIPWARLTGTPPAPGAVLRLNVCVNDEDRQPGKGFTYLEWTPGINYGKQPELYPVVTLGE